MDLLTWITLALLPAFLMMDLLKRKRRYSVTVDWRIRAFVVTVINFLFTMQVGTWWGMLFGEAHLVDGSSWGVVGGAVLGVLIYELFHYAYHRLAHRWNVLWRAGHQMHHSAESLDVFGAFYLHPLDAALFTTISSLVFYPLLGLAPLAAAWCAAILTFNAVFQHADIKTPQWLGYLIQRPESHSLHHARGVHAYNYSDLPLWDMVFGTFKNPSEFACEQGFYDGASKRILAMLVGRDVSQAEQAQEAFEDPALA